MVKKKAAKLNLRPSGLKIQLATSVADLDKVADGNMAVGNSPEEEKEGSTVVEHR